MRIELTEPKEGKETAQLSEEEKEKLGTVSIEAAAHSPLSLSIYAKEGIGSSGKMHRGG